MLNREKFLLDRQSAIGGSDAAAVFGMSPYHTPLSLYMQKIGCYNEKVTAAKEEIFERGNVLEPFLKAIFERDYCMDIMHKEQSVHRDHEFIKGHVDGLTEGGRAIVEFKTSSMNSSDEWGEEMSDSIPKHYLLQTHHYLLIHEECEKAYVPVLHTNPTTLKILTNLIKKYGIDLNLLDDVDLKLKLYVVKRNDKITGLMIKKYIEFWNNHVIPRVPPKWTTCKDLALLFPESKDKAAIADEEQVLAAQRIKQKQEAIKQLEAEIEAEKTLICSKLQDCNKLIDKEGNKIATWLSVTAKRFDQNAFKEKYSDLAQQFYKSMTTRTFKVY